jgi:glutamyl-tRNA synthetase
MKLRFAPSPTGNLHVGNARTLLLNWLYAKKHEATFVLRFDDTDPERSREEYAQQIKVDMAWLGLTYAQAFKQSDRLAFYETAAEQLKAAGRLYPCFETKNELDFKRKRQLSQGRPPLYDRAALKLSADEIKKLEAEGNQPHWRFKVEGGEISWQDLSHGPLSFRGENLSDPILIRENGTPVFTLSGIVDDKEMGITHIVRGNDHITNTAIQIQIHEALGGKGSDFTFAHVPLLTGSQGEGLSKRLGSLSLKELREENYEALALVNYLGHLGNPEEPSLAHSLEEMAGAFELEKMGRSSPKFSLEDLGRTNAKLLHTLSFEQIAVRLQELKIPEITPPLWDLLKGNIEKLPDVAHYGAVCYGVLQPLCPEPAYLAQALELLPEGPWTEETWSIWTTALKTATGRSGKTLFMPLRQALTGEDHGPEMKRLLPFIGPEKARLRLSGKKA